MDDLCRGFLSVRGWKAAFPLKAPGAAGRPVPSAPSPEFVKYCQFWLTISGNAV